MKYILLFVGIIYSPTTLAEESPKQLPKENLSFEIMESNTLVTLTKGEFETTQEFEKRKKSLNESKSITVYISETLRYDADTQSYSFSCYRNESKSVLENFANVTKKGKNAFGTEWEWSEKTGETYELDYDCPSENMMQIEVPLKKAKVYRDDFVAILQIEVQPQKWTWSTKLDVPEFGDSFVDNYSIYSKNGFVKAIHFGTQKNGEVYSSNFSKYKSDNSGEYKNDKIVANPIVRIEPKYPAKQKRNKIEGWVKLSFTIGELGNVEDVKVLDAFPKRVFDKEAKRALKYWKYRPKVIDGRPTKQEGMEIKLDFTLD